VKKMGIVFTSQNNPNHVEIFFKRGLELIAIKNSKDGTIWNQK
jgi:hypothetical protein